MSGWKKLIAASAAGAGDEYFFAAHNVGKYMASYNCPHDGMIKTSSNQYVIPQHYNDSPAYYDVSDHTTISAPSTGKQNSLHFINNDGTFAESLSLKYDNVGTTQPYYRNVQGQSFNLLELDDGKIINISTGLSSSQNYGIWVQLWDQSNTSSDHYFYYDYSAASTAAEAGQIIAPISTGSSPSVLVATRSGNYPAILKLSTTTNPLDTCDDGFWTSQFGGTVTTSMITEASGSYYYGALRGDNLYVQQLNGSNPASSPSKSWRWENSSTASKQKIIFAGSKVNSNHVYMGFCYYYAGGYYRSFVFKLDFTNTTPTRVWSKGFHTNSNTLTQSLHVDDDDNLYITCMARNTDPSYNNATNPLIIKCDKDGNFDWAGAIYESNSQRSMYGNTNGLSPSGSPLMMLGLDGQYAIYSVLPPDGTGRSTSTSYDFGTVLGLSNAAIKYIPKTSANLDWGGNTMSSSSTTTNQQINAWNTRSKNYKTPSQLGLTLGNMYSHNTTGVTSDAKTIS